MPFAINLRSDHESAEAIRYLWEKCSSFEASPSMAALDYPPHITLAVYDEMNTELLFAALDEAVVGIPHLTIRFEHLGHFVAPHAIILWAAPTLNEGANLLYERAHSFINSGLCRPSYRPGIWVPHCSLATDIDPSRKAEAIDAANRPIEPFDVVFDVADCASFPPVEVLYERRLPVDA